MGWLLRRAGGRGRGGKWNPSIAVAAGQSRFHLGVHMGHWERPVWPLHGSQVLFKGPSGCIQTLRFPDALHGILQGPVQGTDLQSGISFFIPHPLSWIMSSCQGINLWLVHLNIFDFEFSSLLILQLCLEFINTPFKELFSSNNIPELNPRIELIMASLQKSISTPPPKAFSPLWSNSLKIIKCKKLLPK